jgi:hypothetical protein
MVKSLSNEYQLGFWLERCAFDFRVDGELSNCGVNAIDLVKVDGAWKVAHLMWMTELEGCR